MFIFEIWISEYRIHSQPPPILDNSSLHTRKRYTTVCPRVREDNPLA